MPKTKEYKAMILKHAERLREPEFRMLHAAEQLKSWVMETREQGPALNVKHCAFFPRCRILHDETPLLTREAQGGQDAAVPAVPLEPSMTGITISGLKAGSRASNQRRQRHQQAADEAESEVNFNSLIVQSLMKDHQFDLEEASNIAQAAWRKKATAQRRAAPVPRGQLQQGGPDSDQEACPLDVERGDAIPVRDGVI